jgi:hypothetical protein
VGVVGGWLHEGLVLVSIEEAQVSPARDEHEVWRQRPGVVRRRGRGVRSGEGFGASPLQTVESTFRLLTQGPKPLGLPGRLVDASWPDRLVDLGELRDRLLKPSTGWVVRDAAWRELALRAQRDSPAWVVGATGVALPGLRAVAARLNTGANASGNDDCDAEVLTGFVAALRDVDPDAGRLPARLCWAAYRAGLRLRDRQARDRLVVVSATAGPRVPAPPWAHPDFVLARAVAAGVIDADEAELIGRTRLGGEHLRAVAGELGCGYEAVKKRRQRAEARLVAALRAGDLDGPETLLDAVSAA